MNPHLMQHTLYLTNNIPEYARLTLVKNRMDDGVEYLEKVIYVPVSEDIQTEEHILCKYTFTQYLRDQYISLHFSSIDHLMHTESHKQLAVFCYTVLKEANIINDY